MASKNAEVMRLKAPLDLQVTTTALLAAFVFFAFAITDYPDLLMQHQVMAAQLAMSIPLLMASSLIRVKVAGIPESTLLDKYGYTTFIVGIAMLLNSIGIMLFFLVSTFVSVLFFVINIVMALTYSIVLITDGRETVRHRLMKDLLFAVVLIFLGILTLPL